MLEQLQFVFSACVGKSALDGVSFELLDKVKFSHSRYRVLGL